MILSRRYGDPHRRVGDQCRAVSWTLPDNPGELACMTYTHFIKLSEHLAKKLIGDKKEKFLSTNTFRV